MANGCSPEEIDQLARLLSRGTTSDPKITTVLSDSDVNPSGSAVGEMRSKFGVFSSLRTQRGAFGDEFSASVLNRAQRTYIGYQNFVNGEIKKLNEAISEPLELNIWQRNITGPPAEVRERIGKLLDQFIDSNGRYTGPEGVYKPGEIKAAQNIRNLYNEKFTQGGLDPDTFLNYYLPHMRAKKGPIFSDAGDTPADEILRSRLGQDQIMFVHELERKGNMFDYDMDALGTYETYVRAMGRAKLLKPMLDHLDDNYVDSFFNRRIVSYGGTDYNLVNDAVGYKQWLKLKSHILGAPTDSDKQLFNSVNNLTRMFGKEIDARDTYRASQMIGSLFYSGVLGGPIGTHPASLIRHATRLIPSLAEMGPTYFLQGISKTFEKGSIEALEKRNMLSSAFENIADEVSKARAAGRTISRVTDSSLKLFSASDKLWRAITAYGAEAKFNDYVARGAIEKMPARKAIKDEISKLVSQGKMNDARDIFMFDNLANLEYIYGPANRPEIFRSALGNLAGVLLSYPANTAELIRIFGKEAFQEGNPGPLLRYIGITVGMTMAGAQFAGVDLSNLFWHGAFPTTAPMLELGKDMYMTANYNVKALLGSVVQTGEDDYHKLERERYQKHAADELLNLIPGKRFATDVVKVVEEGNLEAVLKGFGFPPVAEERNRYAKEKAKLKRMEKRSEGGVGGISGLQSP